MRQDSKQIYGPADQTAGGTFSNRPPIDKDLCRYFKQKGYFEQKTISSYKR